MSHPFEKTWWIDGGKILGGRYPGDRSIEVQKQCLNALLDHGITRFVNLQQVDDRGHGGEPFRDYMPLVEPIARSRSISVGFARFPIRDVSIPDLPTALAAINHLDDLIHAGQTPYVHCFGGNGRTGTIIGCWLDENASEATGGRELWQPPESARTHNDSPVASFRMFDISRVVGCGRSTRGISTRRDALTSESAGNRFGKGRRYRQQRLAEPGSNSGVESATVLLEGSRFERTHDGPPATSGDSKRRRSNDPASFHREVMRGVICAHEA